MRVYDYYKYNIVGKVSFQEAVPYLWRMLDELGYIIEGIGFELKDWGEGREVHKLIERFPALQKYRISNLSVTSFEKFGRKDAIYADGQDLDDIFTVFSQIPRKYNFSSGRLLWNGVNWFDDSDAMLTTNSIGLVRRFDDGRKRCTVEIFIDITDEPEPRSSQEIVDRLEPYLGEPEFFSRRCIWEAERLEDNKRKQEHHTALLKVFTLKALPPSNSISGASPVRQSRVPHVTDGRTLQKAFLGTGFEAQKGPNIWDPLYACFDAHGFLYGADVHKYRDTNAFRVSLRISGFNFALYCPGIDYEVTREGESLEILRAFAEFCVKVRDEYGPELARDFGDTPAWYNEQYGSKSSFQ